MHKRMKAALFPAFAVVGLTSLGAQADGASQTLGWIEKATIEPWGTEVKAKLDTGALTSSMHAENIEQYDNGGESWVRFTVEVEDEASGETVEQRFERPLFRELTVRGAGGKEDRSVVLMEICIGQDIYEEQFSLEDRDDMLYPLLLGRRTIQGLGPVDVTKTFTREPKCSEDSTVHIYADKEYDEDIGA
jgi:hypothetical protein